jgi:peptidoglycan/LPS O-acetylase OafA/YrhL
VIREPSERQTELDGLRALACLAVVACHAQVPGCEWGGDIGVELFFGLSSYLITGIVLRRLTAGTFRYRAFMRERLRRIVPPLAVMLITVSVLVCCAVPAGWRSMVLWCAEAAAFLMDIPHATGFMTPFLGHTWTLAVEMQFYLLWPAVISVVNRLARPATALTLIGVGLAAVASMLPYRPAETVPWAFCFGGALAYLVPTGLRPLYGLLSWSPLVALGRLSYGVYLWHFPIVYLMFGQTWPVALALVLTLSTLLAALSYLTIERWAGCAKAPLWPRRASAPGLTEAAA